MSRAASLPVLTALPLWLFAAGLAAATPYDGVYRQAGDADCAQIGVPGGALRIDDGLFEGIGSQCRMTRPVDVVDMAATLYTMECSAGDENWIERALLMQSAEADGIIMLWNGYAFRYDRCSETEIAATAGAPTVQAAEPDDAAPEEIVPALRPVILLPPAGASPDRRPEIVLREVAEPAPRPVLVLPAEPVAVAPRPVIVLPEAAPEPAPEAEAESAPDDGASADDTPESDDTPAGDDAPAEAE